MSGTTIANVKGGNIANTNGLTDRVKTASSASALQTLVTLNDKLGSNSKNGTLKIVNTTKTGEDLKFVRKERWFSFISLSQDRNTKTREAVVALFDKASDGMANKQEFMANVQNVLQKNEGIKNISSLMADLNLRREQSQGKGDANALLQSVRSQQPAHVDARQQSDALHHDQGEKNGLLEDIAKIEASSPENSRSSRLRSTEKDGPHVSGQRKVPVRAASLPQANRVRESIFDDSNWGKNVAFEDARDPNAVGRDSTKLMVDDVDAKQMMRAMGLKNAIDATGVLLGEDSLRKNWIEPNTDTNEMLDQHDKWFERLDSQIQNRELGLHADEAFLNTIRPPVERALAMIDDYLALLDDFKATLGDARQRLLDAGREIPDEQKPEEYGLALSGLDQMLDSLDEHLNEYADIRLSIEDGVERLTTSMRLIGSEYSLELSQAQSRGEQTLRKIQDDSQLLTAQIREAVTTRQRLSSSTLVDAQGAQRFNDHIQDLKSQLNRIDARLGDLAQECAGTLTEIAEYGLSNAEQEPWRQLEATIAQARTLNQSQNEGLQPVVVSARQVEAAKSVPLNAELTKLLSGIKTIDKTSATQRLKEVGDHIRGATALATKLKDQLHPQQAQQLVRLLSPGGRWRNYLNEVHQQFDTARGRDLVSSESALEGLKRSPELAVHAKQREQLTQSATNLQQANAVRGELMQMTAALVQEFITALRNLSQLEDLVGKSPTKNVVLDQVISVYGETEVANLQKLQESFSTAMSLLEDVQRLLPPDSLDVSAWPSLSKAMDEFLPNTLVGEYLNDDRAEDVVELPSAVLVGIKDQLFKVIDDVQALDMAALRAPLSERELQLSRDVQTWQNKVSEQEARISALGVERSRGKAEFDALLNEATQFIASVAR